MEERNDTHVQALPSEIKTILPVKKHSGELQSISDSGLSMWEKAADSGAEKAAKDGSREHPAAQRKAAKRSRTKKYRYCG